MTTETTAPALAPKTLADYSPRNAALIVDAVGRDVTALAGYRTWQKLGRQVRRGEKGAAIRRPVTEADPDDPTRRTIRNVRGGTVFDVTQTDPIEPDRESIVTDAGATLVLHYTAAGYVATCEACRFTIAAWDERSELLDHVCSDWRGVES